ncbi:MAG TPA: FAD-dependent oxidoreductase, partial [Yinghuangia sp.]|nr:FAD-dependent oxidoreductase [Yinghuangia sp.]
DLLPVDPAFRYRFPDGTELDMPHDQAAVGPALADVLGPDAAADWQRLTTHASDLWRVVGRPVLEQPLAGLRDLAGRATAIRDLVRVAPWRSLRTLGRTRLRDPRLRILLDRYATYTGSDPRRAPAALATIVWAEQHFGCWYVRGGLRRLAEALADHCRELGVRVLLDTEVAQVNTTGSGASGVTTADGRVLPADIVVCDADARHLYSRLVDDPRARRPLRSLEKTQPSLSGFVMLLALRGRTPRPAHHRVLFPADYDAEFDALFGNRTRPVADPTVYVSAPDDSTLRPDDDHEAWFVLVNAPRSGPPGSPGTVDWDAPGRASAYADNILDVMAARGLDVRHRVLWRETRTPADLERATAAPGGAIYGSSSNGARAAFLRPSNRSPVPGVFLVGGSAHPGGGLPLVALSAAIVARQIGPA